MVSVAHFLNAVHPRHHDLYLLHNVAFLPIGRFIFYVQANFSASVPFYVQANGPTDIRFWRWLNFPRYTWSRWSSPASRSVSSLAASSRTFGTDIQRQEFVPSGM